LEVFFARKEQVHLLRLGQLQELLFGVLKGRKLGITSKKAKYLDILAKPNKNIADQQ